jgi:class 3 adenylate cyclase
MADLPTGTVTFLFTDIEGSTRLWERSPEAMQSSLARHDEILRDTVKSHGGYVFKEVSDAFCCAFASAPDALGAALAAQRALLEEPWGETEPLRVRMALHAGAAEERGGDYFRPPLNRVARLLSAAHGGQTLLSSATRELVRDQLPSGTGLRDLGERRLKDLVRPERILQLAAPDLPLNLPPLKTLDERLNNLPVQPTALVPDIIFARPITMTRWRRARSSSSPPGGTT